MKKLIYPFTLALLLSSCSFFAGEKSSVKFCETCDEDLKCENESETFTAGKKVYMRLYSEESFDTEILKTSLFLIDGDQEKLIDKTEEKIDSKWNTFCKGVTLLEPGKYKVVFSNGDGKVINEGTMTYE